MRFRSRSTRSNDMSDDISDQVKISESLQAYSEAIFDYSTTELNQKDVGLSSLIDIMLGKNSKQLFRLSS